MALILNLSSSHGERYNSLNEYAKAKACIARNMTWGDSLILGDLPPLPAFSWPKGPSILHLPPQEHIDARYKRNGFILSGAHHRRNLWFVERVLEKFSVSPPVFSRLVKEFKALPHRFEPLDSPRPSLKIFNDAKSTNWEATFAAVKSISPRERLWLICGGQRRGENDAPSLEHIEVFNQVVEKILAIGEASSFVAKFFSSVEIFPDLAKAWKCVSTQLSGTVVFSPGFPSFDQYKNYKERGEHFKTLVEKSMGEKN